MKAPQNIKLMTAQDLFEENRLRYYNISTGEEVIHKKIIAEYNEEKQVININKNQTKLF